MNIFEIKGYVGGLTKRPTTLFVAEFSNGRTAYVCEGGTVVNYTYEEVTTGTWIDELSDYDCFTVNKPIETIEQFKQALND